MLSVEEEYCVRSGIDFANQADFLIAYYHSVLMQHYGPIILVKELPDMNTPYDKMAARSPYDECVDWVS